MMKVSIDEAGEQLAHLVRVMEAGEEVVFTRDGRDAAKLVAVAHRPTPAEKMAAMEAIRASAREKATPGPDAARSQDFLYDDDGLPA